MSLTYNFVVYVWQEASMWADDLITNKQTFDTWQKIPLYFAIIFIFGQPTMTREDKMFIVCRDIHSNFLKKPSWSWTIVIMSNTQLLNLLKPKQENKVTY